MRCDWEAGGKNAKKYFALRNRPRRFEKLLLANTVSMRDNSQTVYEIK